MAKKKRNIKKLLISYIPVAVVLIIMAAALTITRWPSPLGFFLSLLVLAVLYFVLGVVIELILDKINKKKARSDLFKKFSEGQKGELPVNEDAEDIDDDITIAKAPRQGDGAAVSFMRDAQEAEEAEEEEDIDEEAEPAPQEEPQFEVDEDAEADAEDEAMEDIPAIPLNEEPEDEPTFKRRRTGLYQEEAADEDMDFLADPHNTQPEEQEEEAPFGGYLKQTDEADEDADVKVAGRKKSGLAGFFAGAFGNFVDVDEAEKTEEEQPEPEEAVTTAEEEELPAGENAGQEDVPEEKTAGGSGLFTEGAAINIGKTRKREELPELFEPKEEEPKDISFFEGNGEEGEQLVFPEVTKSDEAPEAPQEEDIFADNGDAFIYADEEFEDIPEHPVDHADGFRIEEEPRKPASRTRGIFESVPEADEDDEVEYIPPIPDGTAAAQKGKVKVDSQKIDDLYSFRAGAGEKFFGRNKKR